MKNKRPGHRSLFDFGFQFKLCFEELCIWKASYDLFSAPTLPRLATNNADYYSWPFKFYCEEARYLNLLKQHKKSDSIYTGFVLPEILFIVAQVNAATLGTA